jgi:alpha-1,3-mannosylglycoprotein beta-1,4-N-acetylglucosaminyltransferase A/B
MNWTANTIIELKKRYKKEIKTGLMDIIIPPESYYPNYLEKNLTDPIFNDSKERIMWRQNQNLDICFLMAYCKERGNYYLNLEDDILSRYKFISDILQFIKISNIEKQRWLMIEFSQLGFIGKLFKSK